MEITNQLIDSLAQLAKLTFDEDEKKEIKTDLQKMISFIEKLSEVDTRGVEPLMFMTNEVNVLRNDEIQGSVSRSEGLLNAPYKDDVYIKVPKVIQKQ